MTNSFPLRSPHLKFWFRLTDGCALGGVPVSPASLMCVSGDGGDAGSEKRRVVCRLTMGSAGSLVAGGSSAGEIMVGGDCVEEASSENSSWVEFSGSPAGWLKVATPEDSLSSLHRGVAAALTGPFLHRPFARGTQFLHTCSVPLLEHVQCLQVP